MVKLYRDSALTEKIAPTYEERVPLADGMEKLVYPRGYPEYVGATFPDTFYVWRLNTETGEVDSAKIANGKVYWFDTYNALHLWIARNRYLLRHDSAKSYTFNPIKFEAGEYSEIRFYNSLFDTTIMAERVQLPRMPLDADLKYTRIVRGDNSETYDTTVFIDTSRFWADDVEYPDSVFHGLNF